MVPSIGEAVRRLPPSRMSLAVGRGADSGAAPRSYVGRFRGQADVHGWQSGDRPKQAHEHSSTAALLSVGGAFMKSCLQIAVAVAAAVVLSGAEPSLGADSKS